MELPGGVASDPIGVALLHRDVGILILCIGDMETERNLLDPLAKSILQFCRLLLKDGHVVSEKVRSLDELARTWRKGQAAFTHVVLIGHGSKDGLKFAMDEWVGADKIGESIRIRGAPKEDR